MEYSPAFSTNGNTCFVVTKYGVVPNWRHWSLFLGSPHPSAAIMTMLLWRLKQVPHWGAAIPGWLPMDVRIAGKRWYPVC
jgi:hypothetical protein